MFSKFCWGRQMVGKFMTDAFLSYPTVCQSYWVDQRVIHKGSILPESYEVCYFVAGLSMMTNTGITRVLPIA